MPTLVEFMILSGADNHPPMLEKHLYDSWKSIMVLYMQNREHGRMILESVKHGPLTWPKIEENGMTRTKKYEELSATEKIQVDCDLKATNIILQGLPSDVYSLVNHHRVSKDLWERISLLMQGTSLTKQEKECKLYDAFDKFAHIKGESLHQYYLRFTQLINDMNIYKMKLKQFQLHAYLEQHELHANEVCIMRDRNQDPLALVANHQVTPSHFNTYQSSYNNPQFQQQFSPSQPPQYGSIHPTQHYSTTYPSTPYAITYPLTPHPNDYSSTIHQDAYPQPQSIPQIEYNVSTVNQQTHLAEFPHIDSGLAVPLRNSSNPRQQATIHDGRVTVQPVQGRQSSFAASTSGTRANISGISHMARQCPKLKRKRDATWFRDKVLLVEAQEFGKVLNEEEFEFLADLGVAEGPVTQTVITHNAAYQADDLDAYDSNCDDFSIAKAILMANLSSYGSYVLSEVPHSENTHSDMLNQSVQEMSYSEQTHLRNYPENEITSDSNIIPYSQYMLETQNAVVQDTNSPAQQDAMILSVFEQLSNQVTNCNKVNKDNLIANESLSVELERYKERIRLMLYDGSVIAKETNMISFADSEETLMLEEESRSKILLKQSDPKVLEKKVNIKPINYAELNRLSEDFGKRFIPQQELSDEQAFRLQTSHPNTDQSASLPVKIEALRELPKVSLVNTSLKKLKYHLGQFDNAVKKRITSDALTEREWGKEERSLINTSFLDEYECSSLALKWEGRDEKKRLDHLKQDQDMLVIKIFSERNNVFRERKKYEKIRAKRSDFQQGMKQYL
ncbi:hypothetical protein Tco_0392492 [Tanacetum coccineum]